MKVFLEYVWLDGNQPQQLRSKTKIIDVTLDEKGLPQIPPPPDWSFDGSSTKQAKAGKGENTDCILKPVKVVVDPFRGNPHRIVLCSVFKPDGETPHETNKRSELWEFIKNNEKLLELEKNYSTSSWFGWEQEYTLTTKNHDHLHEFGEGEGLPLGHKPGPKGNPRPQGDYYCGIGSDSVVGRNIVEEHMRLCSAIGLDISGINAEVMLGQWEYQIGPVSSIDGADQLWISRYILQRVAEKNGVIVSFHPKPMSGDWNGSGCHVNYSTKEMRDEGGLDEIIRVVNKMADLHDEHISVYGIDNDKRMTGEHETSNINEFSWGYSTRDTSVRVPAQTKLDGKGYFEDRRPASNCDPYLVVKRMLETTYNTVEETAEV
jgi:glutamine synthetase